MSDFPLVFKGGTYLWFFSGLNRFSEDLDFTMDGKVSNDISETVSRRLELYGVENETKNISDNHLGYSFRIRASGPLHTSDKDKCTVKVEISGREKVLLERIRIRVDFPEYQLPVHRMLGMSLQEVGSEKIRAILTRKKARDIYDLYHLVTMKEIGFNLELTNEKLRYYHRTFSAHEFIDQLESRENQFTGELRGTVFGELPKYFEVIEALKRWIYGPTIGGKESGA